MSIRVDEATPRPGASPPQNRGRHDQVPLVVAYDISDNRRRNRLYKLLHGFGDPLQKSVFLCWLDAPAHGRFTKLLEDFSQATHQGEERIECIPARADTFVRPDPNWVFE